MEICRTCLEDVDLPAVGNAKKGTCDICHSTELIVMTTSKEKYESAVKVFEGGTLDPSLQADVTTSLVVTDSNNDKRGVESVVHNNVTLLKPNDPSAVIAYKSRDGKLFLTPEEKDEYEKSLISSIITDGLKLIDDKFFLSIESLEKISEIMSIRDLCIFVGELPMSREE